jgi:O-antigen/teichoic acid export membrane protein
MGVIQRQGIQSTIITFSGIFLGMLSLLVLQPIFLSSEEIGLTRVLFSFSFLVSTVLPMSAGNITTRYFSKFRDSHLKHHGFLGFILLFPLIGSLIALPLLFFLKDWFISLYSKESELFARYFIWIFPLSIILSLISILNNYLFSVFRPLLPALSQEVLIRFFFIVLIIIYANGFLNLSQFIATYIGTFLVQLILLLIQAIRVGHISLKPDWEFIKLPFVKEMLIYGWTVFFAGIASMAIKLLDTIVLGQFVSLSLVGIYSIAAFIPMFIEAPINALDKIANARIAYSWEKNDIENIKEIYYKSSRYLFLIGGFLFLMVSINTPHLFHFLPVVFKAGIPAVQILSLSALFNLMTGSNNAIIFTSNRFFVGTVALISITLINLLLLYILIPKWGIVGAAWATCISSFLFNAFKYMYIWVRFKLQPFDKRTLFIAVSISLSYGIAKFLPLFENVFLNIFIHSFVLTSSFTLLIWYSRTADDLKQLLPFFKNKQ